MVMVIKKKKKPQRLLSGLSETHSYLIQIFAKGKQILYNAVLSPSSLAHTQQWPIESKANFRGLCASIKHKCAAFLISI